MNMPMMISVCLCALVCVCVCACTPNVCALHYNEVPGLSIVQPTPVLSFHTQTLKCSSHQISAQKSETILCAHISFSQDFIYTYKSCLQYFGLIFYSTSIQLMKIIVFYLGKMFLIIAHFLEYQIMICGIYSNFYCSFVLLFYWFSGGKGRNNSRGVSEAMCSLKPSLGNKDNQEPKSDDFHIERKKERKKKKERKRQWKIWEMFSLKYEEQEQRSSLQLEMNIFSLLIEVTLTQHHLCLP